MKNLNTRTILLSILAVIAAVIMTAMTYQFCKGYIPQIVFVLWRCWFNYQTYIRGIVKNKYLSWYRTAGVIAAIIIFEAVLTLVLSAGGFY